MNIKKTWFVMCLFAVLSLGVMTSCATAAQQEKVNVLLVKQKELKDELIVAYERHKEGKLTTKELSVLKDSIQNNIEATQKEVESLKEEGLGWGELVGAVAMGIVSRGIPSKGPLSAIFSMFASRGRED